MIDPGLISYQSIEVPDWWEWQFPDGGWPYCDGEEEEDDSDAGEGD